MIGDAHAYLKHPQRLIQQSKTEPEEAFFSDDRQVMTENCFQASTAWNSNYTALECNGNLYNLLGIHIET